jgi:hypothetical protein
MVKNRYQKEGSDLKLAGLEGTAPLQRSSSGEIKTLPGG